MRSIDPIEVKTPLRDKLRSLKSLRSNAIIEEDVEEVAFQPPIVLINILCIFPKEIISEISPRSINLHTTVRLPLLLILLSAGMINGYCVALIKCGGEALTS